MPTLCKVAGTSAPADRVLDGTNILTVFQGKEMKRKKPLYWQFNYAKSDPRVVIRDGDWKLLSKLDINDQGNLTDITEEQMKQLKTAKLQGFELYNLKEDRNETTDLSQSHPQQLKKMVAAMTEIYTEVQQEGPVWPAWDWPRYEGKRIEWPPYRGK